MKKMFSVEDLLHALPQINLIKDKSLQQGVIRAWQLAYEDSAFEDILCPFSPEYKDMLLTEHISNVSQSAYDLACFLNTRYPYGLNTDYVLAIALVHDLCKLRDNIPIGDTVDKSGDGHQMPHAFFSAYYALLGGLPTVIASGALTHSTHTKKVPTTPEAIVVAYADLCDTDMHRYAHGRELNIEAFHRDIKLC